MSATSYGWLVLGFPLAGLLVISLSAASGRARCPGGRRLDRQRRDLRLVPVLDRRAARTCSTAPRRSARWSTRRGTTRPPATSRSTSSILVDPLSVFMCLVVSGVSFLIHVYSVAYMGGDRGYVALLRLPQLLRLLDAAARPGGNFVLLIVGWAFVGAASYLLISFWYRREHRHARRHQGVRDQRDRRRRARDRARSCSSTRPARSTTRASSAARRTPSDRQRRHARGRLPADPRRRLREVRAAAAAHLAPGRDGGPDAGLRADPRGDDGHRRRLPDRAHAPAVRARADGRRRQRDHRHGDAACSRPRSRSWSPTSSGSIAYSHDLARSATWCSASRCSPTAPGSST